MNIQQIRQKYPQYNDLSDEQLAKGLHQKFYSDLPFDVFSQKIGFAKATPSEPVLSPEELLTPIAESPEVAALREKTRQYEAGTTMAERAKRDLQRGVIALQKMPSELQVSSIQKEIDRIRSGKAGRTDTLTGEFIPMAPEEEAAAIAALQARQAEALQDVQKRRAEMQAIPARPVTEAVGGAKTFGEGLQAFGADPLGAMAGFSLESLPQMAPALATAVITKQPALGAAAMGGTSFTSELSNSVFEYLEDQGININDSQAVLKALDDPKIFKEAYDFAIKRGAIIGTLDAASAGLASKALVPKRLIGSPRAREAVNIAIAQPASQVISGAGGEALAQLSTYGEIKKPGAVIAEFVGEGPTSIAETAAFGGRRIYEELRGKEAAPAEVTAEAPKPAAKAKAPRVEPTMPEEAEAPITPAFAEEELEGVEPAVAAPKVVAPAEAQPRVDALQAEYDRIEAKRQDPSIAPDSPEMQEFDARQSEIRQEIRSLQAAPKAAPTVAPVTEDLYDQLLKATPAELKKIDIPRSQAPDLLERFTVEDIKNPALEKKLLKIVNSLTPEEYQASRGVTEAEPAQKPKVKTKPTKEEQAAINRERQAAKRQAAEMAELKLPVEQQPYMSSLVRGLRTIEIDKLNDEYGELQRETWKKVDEAPPDERSELRKQYQDRLDALGEKIGEARRRMEALPRPPGGWPKKPPTIPVKATKTPATKAAKEEHVEAGEAKPITKPVIQEAVAKGARGEDIDYAAMRKEVERQVDEAIAKSPYKDDDEWNATAKSRRDFVTFSIPNDGTFKIKNNKERLAEFKKRLTAAVKPKEGRGPQFAISPASVETTLRDLVDSNDIQSAIEFASLKGIKISESKLDLKQKLKVQEYIKDPEAFEEKVAREASYTEEQRQRMREAEEKRRIETNKRLAEEQEAKEKATLEDDVATVMTSSDRDFKAMIKEITKRQAEKILDKIDETEATVNEQRLEALQRKAETFVDQRVKQFTSKLKSPSQIFDANKQLFRKMPTAEGPISIHELVENQVDAGAEIITSPGGERKFGLPGDYSSEKQLGEFGMDYAGYLIAQRKKAPKAKASKDDIELSNIDQNLPGAKKKLPPGRSPELAAAAQQLQSGEITKQEFDELVNRYKPIPVYTEALKPATSEQVFDALDTAKRDKINPDIKPGTSVGLRLDIPAFNRKGIFVVSIHEKRTPSAAGKTIGYGSVAKIKDVTFGLGKETKALEIAAGASKDVLQTMEGKWIPTTPEQAYKEAQAAIKNPEWIQIGIDPTRHSYFYDRRTTQPVIKAEEIIQIGNMILGKGVVFGDKNDFLYNIATDPVTTDTEVQDGIKNARKEQLEKLSSLARKKSELIKKVRNYGSDIETQRLLNELEDEIKMFRLGSAIREPSTSAEAFLKHARDAMDGTGPFREPVITPDVFATIQAAYIKTPWILEGLKLSIKTPKETGGTAGVFLPYERIVRLYSGTTGVENPVTPRHELMHSLEQMMTKGVKDVVIKAWATDLNKAIKKYTDKRSQEYFHKIMDFLENPSETTRQEALAVLPSYDLYQYINPSEYWAINAEKLFASKLGTAWERFKKAISKLFEGLKSVFGFNNTYAVHKIFDDLIKNKPARMNRDSLVNYMLSGKADIKFLMNVEDVDNLLEKHNRPDAPLHPSNSVKDRMLGAYRGTRKIGERVIDDPLGVGKGVIAGADRAITYARNKNVWYGTGVDQADFSRYNGQLRDAQGKAVASIAVTNAIHAGHVGTQVMVQGALEFNTKTQQFMAKKSNKSMANVLKEKAKLVNELGGQRAANVIQAYFEAKRSRSIVNEYLEREQLYQQALDAGENPEKAAEDLANIERAMSKVNMDDEQIDEFIALENDYPALRAMMDNWTAVNQNQLDMSYFAGNLSKARYEQLKAIKDYVPWYRIMDDQKDPHDFPTGGTTRTMTNVAREKRFKAGEVDLDIDDIVDNMIHNVMWMTKNTMRNYAANRIADEYGIRNEKGKLKVFPKEGADSDGVKFNILRNGRRIVIGVADPLIAEAAIGMENVEIPMNKILSIMANGLRRSITLSGAFQLKQLFMDAPTAAWVSGVKNPFAVWSNTFIAFGKVLVDKDPIAQKLRQAGIGGFMSTARTPEQELALEIGLLNKSMYSKVMRVLDHIGDASDYAQRVAIYKQVLKETGDEAQALLQANNVIDFLKRGSGQTAQFLSRTVSFMNAYAQSVDVLATTLAGGSLKGMARQKAITRMAITGGLLSFATLLYCFAVGDDEEYEKLDDQTKLRNFVIPGSKKYFGETVILPMHTSASFFFKAIPELLYNKITREGAETEMDSRRFRRALKEAFMDSMLGPNVVPTGAKPFIEIGLNKNFWTGTTVIPKGMEDLVAAEQYTAATSELGKVVSALTSIPGTDDKRLLAPIEADHLMRSLFGSAAAMAMWGTNMLAGDRAESRVKDLPVIGAFVLPPVPRGREDLFYDLKEQTDQKWKTFNTLLEREKFDEADKYLDKHEGLIGLHDYTSQMDSALKEINKEIRRIGTTSAKDMSPKERRQEMNELGTLKGEILEGIESLRRQAFD